jgi:hypothetical protein
MQEGWIYKEGRRGGKAGMEKGPELATDETLIKHGCRKGPIYKEAMKTGKETKNGNADGWGKDIEQEVPERRLAAKERRERKKEETRIPRIDGSFEGTDRIEK